jgi:hypothetical protein
MKEFVCIFIQIDEVDTSVDINDIVYTNQKYSFSSDRSTEKFLPFPTSIDVINIFAENRTDAIKKARAKNPHDTFYLVLDESENDPNSLLVAGFYPEAICLLGRLLIVELVDAKIKNYFGGRYKRYILECLIY